MKIKHHSGASLTFGADGSLTVSDGVAVFRDTTGITKDADVADVHISNAGGDGKGKKRRARSFQAVMDENKETTVDKTEWGAFFEITKTDEDQNLVFGWANIVEKDGVIVTDSQGDQIDIAELERAVYDYALFKREAGEMHQRTSGVGQMVESLVMTLEKQKALGIPEGSTPLGWWVGFKLADDVFKSVKSGKYSMFSIGGLALREEI